MRVPVPEEACVNRVELADFRRDPTSVMRRASAEPVAVTEHDHVLAIVGVTRTPAFQALLDEVQRAEDELADPVTTLVEASGWLD